MEKDKKTPKNFNDLTGKIFGQLYIESRAENKRGRVAWNCRCSCGNHCVVAGHELVANKTKSCGCLVRERGKNVKNIKGQHFGELEVMYLTEKRDYKGSALWYCRCSCGREVELSQDALVHGAYKSCGCKQYEQSVHLAEYLHFYNGTCLEYLTRPKRSDNTSGTPGVYPVGDKYFAKIGFQGTHYYLGRYETFEEAREVRAAAEQKLHKAFVEAYGRWQRQKKEMPEETEEFYFSVEKSGKEFIVHSNYAAEKAMMLSFVKRSKQKQQRKEPKEREREWTTLARG